MTLDHIWTERSRTWVLLASACLIATVAVVDWATKPYVSLGFLYLFPIMISAAFLPRWSIALLGVGCAILSSLFSGLPLSWVRIGFETSALAGCGLFVGELVRNRRYTLAAEKRTRVLIETSPAAIITVDSRGIIDLCNRAAVDLLSPRDGQLTGAPVAAFFPELHYALRLDDGPQFRTALQCHAHRGDGASFTADIWFSTYLEDRTPKLAAIIADVSEETALVGSSINPQISGKRIELTDREIDILKLVVQGSANKEIADKMQVSESTVKNALQQLFAKTNVRTRSQLVRVALEQYRDLI